MSALNHEAARVAIQESQIRGSAINERINNRGDRVDVYLEYARRLPNDHEATGPQYCGMFVNWCYGEAGRRLGIRSNPVPRAVFGGSAFATWANARESLIVYRAGSATEPILEPGDIFVVSNFSHVGMVVEPIQDFQVRPRDRHPISHGFVSVEGNQADPLRHPEWGLRGVTRKRVALTSCALIVRL